jgi:hypothetical protein
LEGASLKYTPKVRRPTPDARHGAILEEIKLMSKNNNVNPGQYKVAGRLRPDDEARHERGKEKAGVAKHELREQSRAERKKKRD